MRQQGTMEADSGRQVHVGNPSIAVQAAGPGIEAEHPGNKLRYVAARIVSQRLADVLQSQARVSREADGRINCRGRPVSDLFCASSVIYCSCQAVAFLDSGVDKLASQPGEGSNPAK